MYHFGAVYRLGLGPDDGGQRRDDGAGGLQAQQGGAAQLQRVDALGVKGRDPLDGQGLDRIAPCGVLFRRAGSGGERQGGSHRQADGLHCGVS